MCSKKGLRLGFKELQQEPRKLFQ